MYIMKLGAIGYTYNEDHPISYVERILTVLGHNDMSINVISFTDVEKRIVSEGNYKLVTAETFEEGLEILAQQVRVMFQEIDPKDLYITEVHSEVEEDGCFWLPNTTTCGRYRLSDLKKV